jgi:hypothetical protein
MDAILQTHCISSTFLRDDDFVGFFQNRKATLLSLVEQAMGKQAVAAGEPVGEDDSEAGDED